MNKQDFVDKWWTDWSIGTPESIKQAMMIDLRFVIKQAIQEQKELDLLNTDQE